MRKGAVNWFNATKGFGFIADEESGRDLFVQRSGIVMASGALEAGQIVTFEIEESEKGPQAVNVRAV
ncbi:MAG: cold shock domain-containing protein [bacterium]|nr:cold shock domain-containing protein [bacterium]